jgi:hypothetical protein
MATDYRKTKNPCRPWRPADHAAFSAVRDSLKWESYPNGECGWEDRALPKFERAGFVAVPRGHAGSAAVAALVILDLGAARQ